MANGDQRPLASRYDEYRRVAARAMFASRDSDVRAAADRLLARTLATTAAVAVVKRRLTVINNATSEAAELRNALSNLDAMIYVEKSSHVGEHKIPGAERTKVSNAGAPAGARGFNALHDRLAREMIVAGATSKAAHDISFVMLWNATGRSLSDLVRNHPGAWDKFSAAAKNVPIPVLGQWEERAHYLAKGGK